MCAACAGMPLVEAAERRSGVLRDEPTAEKVPLVGTCQDPFQVVKKSDLVAAARADAARLRAANPIKLEGPGGGTLGGPLHEKERCQGPGASWGDDRLHPARRQMEFVGGHGVRRGGQGGTLA